MVTSRIAQIYGRVKPRMAAGDDLFLWVDTISQKVLVCRGATVTDSFDASTSLRGLGNREGSNKTPTGLHRIKEKIGAGAPAARIFRDRRDTGADWHQDLTEDNLILSRILRLEGIEAGLNKGPHIDSYDRFIYLHGTNKENRVGSPLSHGCVCLRPNDIIRLFDMVHEGTLVFIDAAPLTVNGFPCSHLHFTGIFGSGMSALAQYLQWSGVMVSGSDRLLDSPDTAPLHHKLAGAGCNLFSQDGSGLTLSTDALCVSTAIEESNPDIAAARSCGLPIFHRSDVLAAIVATKQTIAVAGTSGKSTVTAMTFEFLTACKKSPSLISGAPIIRLENEGLIGNAFFGPSSGPLVIEADESDGTLVKYHPSAGVLLNISKDHKSVTEIESLFQTFASQSAWVAVNADDPGLSRVHGQERFGMTPLATWKPENVELLPDSVRLYRKGSCMHLPLPGQHNAENLCAALCVCEHLGCDPATLAAAVKNYRGVARRFALARTRRRVYVVDDFAHNPAKIAAVVKAARGLSSRIIAVYQPHGFGPTKFLKNDYIAAFKEIFTGTDALFLLPIYYAGGTAVKDISSQDIVCGLGNVPFTAQSINDREALLDRLSREAKPGDCVLLMGARDPSLPNLVRKIIEVFGGAELQA
jgi:UDP-N-acetylmuramate--alanine ligase